MCLCVFCDCLTHTRKHEIATAQLILHPFDLNSTCDFASVRYTHVCMRLFVYEVNALTLNFILTFISSSNSFLVISISVAYKYAENMAACVYNSSLFFSQFLSIKWARPFSALIIVGVIVVVVDKSMTYAQFLNGTRFIFSNTLIPFKKIHLSHIKNSVCYDLDLGLDLDAMPTVSPHLSI